ncbi:kinase-like domain-containing protein [Paramyrothecium foliicola]|nr:kinase-like domain-containing protein [Paramyrothecium foliicola]
MAPADLMRDPINLPALVEYFQAKVPRIQLPVAIKQFSHGQSNPTYEIRSTSGDKFVLRKKPPGSLLSKSAHRIEREYKVMKALENTDVPVPRVYCFCDDSTIIGSPFYIMEFLDGRIFEDVWLPEMSASERVSIWKEAVNTLAKVHSVQLGSVGLESLKRPESYYSRVGRSWSQISAVQARTRCSTTGQVVGHLPYYADLVQFFLNPRSEPADHKKLVHGDYKLDNLVFHKTEPRIIGILDWEMVTEGHPLSDLATLLSPFSWSPEQVPVLTNFSLTAELEEWRLKCSAEYSAGLPTAKDCQAWYKELTGYDVARDMDWAFAFGCFRTAIIMQGIAARVITGQATGVQARQFAAQALPYALWSWARVQAIISHTPIRPNI